MQKNKINNIIVLKEISSNIVEEAIVVLKPHVNFKEHVAIEKTRKNEQIENKNKTILKEAEFVIEDCIAQMQNKNRKRENQKLENKYKILKKVTIILAIFNVFLLLNLF